ncbi:MAG: HRDC domain-containing protein [Candidatus Riflebacteria bacterium]|nr:HRDC domain-containing protein [Candidatus Riflebacteria bacterium]
MISFDSQKLLQNSTVIETKEELVRFLDEMNDSDVIALDCESAGFYKYYFKVNLIQISSRHRAAILDPQAIDDFSPLVEFSKKPGREWVFHGCEFDARILSRDFNLNFDKIFDTLHAAEILGIPEIGLSSLCEKYFGFTLDKKLQKCDWSKRPLTPQMHEYCLLDAIMLIPLREIMIDALKTLNRYSWATEEFDFLAKIRCMEPEHHNIRDFRIKGSSHLPPKSQLILKEIWNFRESIAKKIDRAPFMLLPNEALLEIARKAPRSMKGLETVKSLPHSFLQSYGKEIITAVKTGLLGEIAVLSEPTPSKHVPPEKNRFLAWEGELARIMREKRDQIASNLKIQAPILASGDVIALIAHERPLKQEDFVRKGLLRKWQADLLAESFIEIISAAQAPRIVKKRKRRTPRKT